MELADKLIIGYFVVLALFLGGSYTFLKILRGKRKNNSATSSTFLTEPLTFDEASVLLASITMTARFRLATFANREELLNIYADRLRVLLAHDPAYVSALNQELKDIIKLTTTEV